MPLRKIPNAQDMMKILTAVYDVGRTKESWLTGVLRAVSSTLDPGAGVGGLLYDISGDNQLNAEVMEGVGIPDGWREVGLAMHRDPRWIPRIVAGYRSMLCATLAEAVPDPQVRETLRGDHYARHGVGEQIYINGADCSGKGCVLFLFARGSIILSEPLRDLLSRLATHLSTAYRLQRRLATTDETTFGRIHAVLTPNGLVDHADAATSSSEARKSLRLAVLQRESARNSVAVNAERVVRSLKGLVDARWTLVDHYESGGKRYVVARENAPQPLGPSRLSQRERQVVALAVLGRSDKLIAYELGLAYSTVRVLMARASAKVGARTRPELISRLSATNKP